MSRFGDLGSPRLLPSRSNVRSFAWLFFRQSDGPAYGPARNDADRHGHRHRGYLALLPVYGLSMPSPHLRPDLSRGVQWGTELYYILGITDQGPLIVVMGLVALGELIAVGIGYGIFMGLMRNRPFMNLLCPTRHQNAKW